MIYQLQRTLNLYDAPGGERLATQARVGRWCQIVAEIPIEESPREESPREETPRALRLRLCEDDYEGWIAPGDQDALVLTNTEYQPVFVTPEEIQAQIPQVIAFCERAMATPHHYLWGGTVAPNYDCSGLMQAAFADLGIWLPRDAYQQEAFVQRIPLTVRYPLEAADLAKLQPGDLIFFGSPVKATHVALHLGEGRYLHSSGKDQGRNGIGIDTLQASGDAISQTYGRQLRGAGRVVASYGTRSGARGQE
jgi:hypothetical protein